MFFFRFVRLTLLFFFTLSKRLDDAQPFLGYVLSTRTKLSFSILIFSASRAHSFAGGILMNRRQL